MLFILSDLLYLLVTDTILQDLAHHTLWCMIHAQKMT